MNCQIEKMLERFPLRTVPKGVVLNNHFPNCMFFIVSGHVVARKMKDARLTMILGEYFEKRFFYVESYFGWTQQEQHIEYITKDSTKLYVMNHDRFTAALAEMPPAFYLAMMNSLSEDYIAMQERALDHALLNGKERVKKFMLSRRSLKSAMTHPRGHQITISRVAISQYTWLCREHISRELDKLIDDGIIEGESHKHKFVLVDDRLCKQVV